MSPFMIAAFVCHMIGVFVLASFALVYLLRRTCMPYHLKSLGGDWQKLPSGTRAVVLALMRAAAAGPAGAALANTILLLGPFAGGEMWARWAIPAIGGLVAMIGLFAMHTASRAGATPPFIPVIAGIGLGLLGLLLSLL